MAITWTSTSISQADNKSITMKNEMEQVNSMIPLPNQN